MIYDFGLICSDVYYWVYINKKDRLFICLSCGVEGTRTLDPRRDRPVF